MTTEVFLILALQRITLRAKGPKVRSKVLSCHRTAEEPVCAAKKAAVCPRATDHCTSCHMQKVKVAEMHGDFTDHFICIERPDGRSQTEFRRCILSIWPKKSPSVEQRL